MSINVVMLYLFCVRVCGVAMLLQWRKESDYLIRKIAGKTPGNGQKTPENDQYQKNCSTILPFISLSRQSISSPENITGQRDGPTEKPTDEPTNGPTDGRTDRRTDIPSYARTHLKTQRKAPKTAKEHCGCIQNHHGRIYLPARTYFTI